MMPVPYSSLLTVYSPHLDERKTGYHFLTERHLQAVWLEQKYVQKFITSQGEAIEVLSPGLWNTEAGPDFLKAHIRIGQIDYRGDIEIHLHDEGWYTHHHHEDKRYNQVVLHLSYHSPRQVKTIRKENGHAVFQSYLDISLTIPPSRLIGLVDLELYPHKRFVGSGRCAQKLFKNLPDEKTRALLTAAAYWRLEKKEENLKNRLADRSLQLAGGIAMALGYRHNAEAFLELFLFLLPYRDVPYQELLAIALGCCGFFEEGRKIEWEQSIYYQQLRLIWKGWGNQITHQATLRLDHIRPLNHPIRRLVYLVNFLQDSTFDSLWMDLLALWQKERGLVQTVKEATHLGQKLIQLIPTYEDLYWKHHFIFENRLQAKNLSLLGDKLKMEMLINTVLPLLYATIKEKGDPVEWQALQLLYQSLKSPSSSKKRYLIQRFFGDESKMALFKQAQIVQGAYQIHKDFCMHFEASCEGCPFVERYLNRH